ncbi:MAG: hypothetical protein HZA15_03330 [Nitrospirae bacterium]|nr:hypothetical protein [Nitrospirota bacterium]
MLDTRNIEIDMIRTMLKDDNNSQYIEGSPGVRIVLFSFLGFCGLIGILLKIIAEKKIEQINTAGNATEALAQLNDIFLKFLIVPLSVFCTVQGLYLIWLGVQTMRAGVYPPPSVKMPFRTKVQTGIKANISAITFLFAGVCNFVIIAVLLMMRHGIFKHI